MPPTSWKSAEAGLKLGEKNQEGLLVGAGFSPPYIRIEERGLSWLSSGLDSVLPLQGAQVRSLVMEVLHAVKRSQKKKKNTRRELKTASPVDQA